VSVVNPSWRFTARGIEDVNRVVADLFNTVNNPQKVSVNLLTDAHIRTLIVADLKVPFALKGDIRQDDTPVHQALREAMVNTRHGLIWT
jgi:hypothetical protein